MQNNRLQKIDFILSPLIGYWSNKIKQIRVPLLACIFLNFIGDFLYMTIALWPSNQNVVILVGRFLAGVGSSKNLKFLQIVNG